MGNKSLQASWGCVTDGFNDDEKIEVKQQLFKQKIGPYNLEQNLNLQIRPKFKCVKASKEVTQLLPVMISVKTETQKVSDDAKSSSSKLPVDLICVIDHSGSMQGEKIDIVRKTLKLLLQFLDENDRLCLIKFDDKASRMTPLARVSKQNIPKFVKQIDELKDGGGTYIAKGMDLAFKQIKQREVKNSVTSIFLLSDGLDLYADVRISQLLKLYKIEEFTIHSFGFGKDHDPVLMTNISKLAFGNFYYIEQLDKVDECFIDALAGVISQVAQNLEIKVIPQFKHPYSDCKISRYLGDQWQQNLQGDGQSIKLANIISGVSKDFLVEIAIPPMDVQIGDENRNAYFFTVEFAADSVGDDKQHLSKEASLVMTFYNQNEEVPNYEEDQDVKFNYLRIIAAENIKEAIGYADKSQFEDGQKLLSNLLSEIDQTNVDKAKKQVLRSDVISAQQLCQPQQYQGGGKHAMMQMEQCWMGQKSKGFKRNSHEVDMFENPAQFSFKKKCMNMKGLQ